MRRVRWERRRSFTQGVMRTGHQYQTPAVGLTVTPPIRKRTDDEILQQLLEYRRTRRSDLRDMIVLHYAGLVESVARRFSNASEPVEDLAQEGYIGLITAIDLYDPTKKVKFSTYATHFIIGQIKHCLRDRGKIIKEPGWLQELNGRITRAISALAQQLHRPPTNGEIAEFMDMTEQAVADLMMTREVFKVTSIHGGSNDDEDDGGALDMDRQCGMDVAVAFQFSVEERIVMETALHKLKELEKKVVTAFYFQDLNQTEIARSLGISCNYVSHILRNSTKKLKKILATDEIRDAQIAFNQSRRKQELQSVGEVIVDSLTRLYNRRYFEMRLEEEVSRASRMGTELCVVFLQIDGWKNFAHSQGTIKADEAITEVAHTIVATLRRTDIATRYDQDRFAIILPHTGHNVEIVCVRLREALHDLLETKPGVSVTSALTFGLGLAVYPRDATQPVPLIGRAQEELDGPYAAVTLPCAA